MNEINNMRLGVPMDMSNPGISFMLPPAELHECLAMYPAHQQTMVSTSTENLMMEEDGDIISAAKRATGIQVAGGPSVFSPTLQEQYCIPVGFSDHSYSSASSDRSSVPPQTIEPGQASSPSSDSSPSEPTGTTTPVATTGRPKTAHTTIERRYRTNLNTCIVGLRDSIPAVRFLDKGYKHSSGILDEVDANGCVDGVKAARKISKATIMSKAREYIVYERRETRMKDEVAGMKELLSSLVGGPRVLQEWEKHWAVRQAAQAVDEDLYSNEDDSDMEDEIDEDEDRPRKKPKLSPIVAAAKVEVKKKAKPSPTIAPASPEERPKKRGRPPKNAAATAAAPIVKPAAQVTFAPISHTASAPVMQQQPGTAQQYSFVSGFPQQQKRPAYLLASFVFLSFFKPSTRSTIIVSDEASNHSHVGRVLGDEAFKVVQIVGVLSYCIVVPGRWRAKAWRWATKSFYTPTAAVEEDETAEDEEIVSVKERAERELRVSNSTPKSKLRVFNALQAIPTHSTEELALMALLRFSSKPSQALELWEEASLRSSKHDEFHLAFETPLPQVVDILSTPSSSNTQSPLMVIASNSLEAKLERMFKDIFVDEVIAVCDLSDAPRHDTGLRRAHEDLAKLALSTGGRPASLVQCWDTAMAGQYSHLLELESTSKSSPSAFTVLKALALMRRIFPNATRYTSGDLPSPHPSPLLAEEQVKMERVLRVSLDDKAFHTHAHGAEGKKEVATAKDMLISRLGHWLGLGGWRFWKVREGSRALLG